MATRERCVLDTNVLVSALLLEGPVPERAFLEARDRSEVLISKALVEELDEVLRRRKLARYIDDDDREAFLEALVRECTLIETPRAGSGR